jgi:putrescine transport system substrate-binding protein
VGARTSALERLAVAPRLRDGELSCAKALSPQRALRYKVEVVRALEKGKRLMFSVRRMAILTLGCLLTLTACGDRKSGSNAPSGAADTARAAADAGKVLNLYIWSDYLAADTLPNFEKQTGIKVHVAYFDTNETLETKLLAGSSGYDVVVPTASYFERQIKAGVYLTLDKSKLPNLKNMDPQLMAKVALHDPDNAHGIIYTWGTNGIGFNEKMVKDLMPDAPLASWRIVFDPAVASKVAKCGISVLDSPAEMLRAVYSYLGKDPNSQSPDDLALAEGVLIKIRPYIRNINSSEYIEALANGDLCIAVGYNGDVMQARDRAREANKGIDIKYIVPKEGSILWFDMLAIPKDAPHPDSAYAYLNYIMTPQVIADISNFKRYANANLASQPLVLDAVKNDPGIYPPPELRQKLAVQLADSADQTRAITRVWQKFKTGQ